MRPHARTRLIRTLASAILYATLSLAAAPSIHAQSFTTHPCTDSNNDDGFFARLLGGGEQVCELRTTTFPLVNGHLNVDTQNGGIEILGEDRNDIYLEARVTARAGSPSDSAALLHQVTIATGPTVEAHGPQTYGNKHWSVSFKLHVPHHLAADLHTLNGGLALSSVDGHIHGETTNGGISLNHLAGDIHLITTNGGISAHLDGSTWHGAGLEATTTNGGVTVSLPSTYSAHLVASTTNGGASLNLPNADQSGVHRHSIDTNLGSGGPTLSFETTNGGISIQ
jgi:DUF4097 and DUF4098 domain-containing protein YvlB